MGPLSLNVRYLNRLLGRGHSCECGPRGKGEHRIAPPCFDECRRAVQRNCAERNALEQIQHEIAALKADKSVPEAEKKEGLAQLETALKNSKPIQFKENIALVLKYFDQLAPFMQAQDSNLRPAD